MALVGLVLVFADVFFRSQTVFATEVSESSLRTQEPRVHTSAGFYDLGTLVGDVVREVELRVHNEGPSEWRTLDTWQDCGCIRIVSAGEVTPVGADLLIHVRIDTRGQPLGSTTRSVYVLAEPGPRLITGLVQAELLPSAHVDPAMLEIELPRGERLFSAESTVRIPDLGGEPMVFVETCPEGISLELGPAQRSDRLVNIPVLITGELPKEHENRSFLPTLRVFMSAASPEGESLGMRVQVKTTRDIIVAPRAVYFDGRSDRLSARIFVKNSRGEPVDTPKWRLDPPSIAEVRLTDVPGCLELRTEPVALSAVASAALVITALGESVSIPLILGAKSQLVHND